MIDRVKELVAELDAWTQRHRTPRVARRAVLGFMNHDALQYAGSMAYFAVLSIFQLIVLAVVVGSLFLGDAAARDFVVEQVDAGTPIDREVITGIIDAVIESRGGITLVSAVFLAWSALGVFSALNRGIARAFESSEPRPFIKDKLVGLFLMGTTGILAVASVVIGLVTGILQEVASGTVGNLPGGALAVHAIGFLAPIVLIFAAFWILYRVVPNRPVAFAEVWPGALVAALLWTALRFGFTWYATSVANYESAFGPISTGVTLLVFLYFASIIILLGAEVARANVVDSEVGVGVTADPRFLPVPTDAGRPAEAGAPTGGGGLRRWVVLGGAAVAGLVVGRLTKGSDEEED